MRLLYKRLMWKYITQLAREVIRIIDLQPSGTVQTFFMHVDPDAPQGVPSRNRALN